MQRWLAAGDGLGNPELDEVVDVLEDGGVIAVPTETYYGLAAHWQRPDALDAVLRLKRRHQTMPLLLLVGGTAMARRVAPEAPEALDRLAAALWPGALTLIVPGPDGLHPALVGPGGSVALRHSPHPVVQQIVARLDAPITGTSANVLGGTPPRRPDQLELSDRAELSGVVDAGDTCGLLASTLLDLSAGPTPRILRAGVVSADQVREVLGGRLL